MKLRALALAALLCGVPALAGAQPPGLAVYEYNNYSNITTNATTTIQPAQLLSQVCINKKGATANTAVVYDGSVATGTVIATIDTTAATGCLSYNVNITKGLITVVTSSGTAGDLTIAYR